MRMASLYDAHRLPPSPYFAAVGLGGTGGGKDAKSNGEACKAQLSAYDLPCDRFGGFQSDHAGLAERKNLFDEVIPSICRSKGLPIPIMSINDIGDEAHKDPLIWKIISQLLFGKDTATPYDFHPLQVIVSCCVSLFHWVLLF